MTSLIQQLQYAANELLTNYKDRNWWRDRMIHRLIKPIHMRSPNRGQAVCEADWDNLIVLDACRADLFETVIGAGQFDSYTTVMSNASATPNWVTRNFAGKAFPTIVYVSGNPQVPKYAADSFVALENVWESQFSDEHGTVPPEAVTEAALGIHEEYPNKRLVVHYMQPHQPFIDRFPGLTQNPFRALRDSTLTYDEVWEAYSHNLELAYASVERLLDQLDGKTVITSDHGNLLGERLAPIPVRGYGHPPGIQHKHLQRVPWAEYHNGGSRRELTEGRISYSTVSQSNIDDRLTQLGYKQ